MRQLKHQPDRQGRIMLYETYSEFVKACLGPSSMDMSDRQSRTNSDQWSGGSWSLAEKLGPRGDVEGAGRLRSAIIKEATHIMGTVTRLDPVYREEGGIWIDVSRYLSGEPEVWGDFIDQGEKRRARQAAIVFNAGANCNVTAKDYERAAVCIGGAILGLKSMGISVSLHVCYHNRGSEEHDLLAIPLTPDGGFDVARLAAVTRTWFFRRLVFSYWETRDEKFREDHHIGGSYGRSEAMNQADAMAVTGVKNAVILNIEEMTYWSDDKIKETILDTIKEEGVTR